MSVKRHIFWEDYRPRLWPGGMSDFVRRAWRLATRSKDRVITLTPDGPARGRVLFSYILEPFLSPARVISHAHVNYWEGHRMAHTFRDAGFVVDVIHWSRPAFRPQHDYDIYVDVRRNFEMIGRQLSPGCRKILHADIAHHAFHNAAQNKRLQELRERRGIDLPPFKLMEENHAIELADEATVLGNEFTMGTYRFAGKPLRRIPISAPFEYPFPENRRLESARKQFIWFGSDGFIHKGLDLVLEAFAGLPEFQLVVCGPLSKEPLFRSAFRRELYQTPNIKTLGWVDVSRPEFLELCAQSLGIVFPSCSEGGGGGVITCMHAGLIPVVTRETSVDIDPAYGILLPDARVATLRAAVQELAARPAEQLDAMARSAWSFARTHHTRAIFAKAYREYVDELVARLCGQN